MATCKMPKVKSNNWKHVVLKVVLNVVWCFNACFTCFYKNEKKHVLRFCLICKFNVFNIYGFYYTSTE